MKLIILKTIITSFLALLLTVLFNQAHAGPGFCVDLRQINNEYFDESTGMVWHPTREKWLVWEKKGAIHLLNPENGISSKIAELTENIDLRGDGGLLSMAVHPDYPEKPFIYITRTILLEENRSLVLERYPLDNYDILTKRKQELLRVVLSGSENTAGFLAFDEIGNLLLSIGDGRNDESTIPSESSNPETLLGSILRLNVDTRNDKAIAAKNNPFRELLDGALEVYAYGFKNPHRFSIDYLTDDIWVSDSGVSIAGEINYILPKFFYGWDCLDGNRIISRSAQCQNQPLEKKPVFQYSTQNGVQVIGGYVYRGNRNENWFGRYFFADYGSGKIWNTVPKADTNFDRITLAYEGHIIPIGFAQDHKNELYLIDYQGKIFEMRDRNCKTPQIRLRR